MSSTAPCPPPEAPDRRAAGPRADASRERRLALCGLTAATLLLAACGGGDGGTDATATPSAAAPPPAASSPSSAASSPSPAASAPSPAASAPSPAASSPSPAASAPSPAASAPSPPPPPPPPPSAPAPAPAPASNFTGSFAGFPLNGSADAWNRLVSVDVTTGNTTVGGIAYRYAYPLTGGNGCAVSGGSGATALFACSELALGELVQLCGSASDTNARLAMLRIGGGVLNSATLTHLLAAAAGGSVQWNGLACDGTAATGERFVLRPDGSADWTLGGVLRTLSAAEVTALFDTNGLTTAGTDRRALRAYRQTVSGVDRFHLLGYGAPLPGSSLSTVSPRLYPAP
ncbi:hypothetical protein [Aquabacterium sp. J223]|uniref:hypothetical protein n=1 Tax=Aquabacterium sp. J223 TaxID=2898431 RepID=UPI0021AD7AC8|nr:hypothetical protein [Aquabacterium sp. J223]UUX96982.1 hypothetical protein LRS07_06890 [Aquabacterium sp. J223]